MSIAVGLLPLPVINKSAEPSRVRPRPFSTARQVGLVDSYKQISGAISCETTTLFYCQTGGLGRQTLRYDLIIIHNNKLLSYTN